MRKLKILLFTSFLGLLSGFCLCFLLATNASEQLVVTKENISLLQKVRECNADLEYFWLSELVEKNDTTYISFKSPVREVYYSIFGIYLDVGIQNMLQADYNVRLVNEGDSIKCLLEY
jgi:hypothetical protein